MSGAGASPLRPVVARVRYVETHVPHISSVELDELNLARKVLDSFEDSYRGDEKPVVLDVSINGKIFTRKDLW